VKTSSKNPVRISDHAVLRYMERAMGLNVEIVRQHITTICAGPAAIGAVCVRAEGVRFEIVNNTVLTVAPDHGKLSDLTRDRNQRAIQRSSQIEA
jgi:hypothetical protein